MKGKKTVIDVLSGLLKSELTAINQYFLHYEITEHLGYKRLAKIRRAQSMHEMKHAEWAMERILSLDASPNVSAYNKINVGKDVLEGLQYDMGLEQEAISFLNDGIQICYAEGDHVTRELLEKILLDEAEHLEWLKTQLQLIESVGYANYLTQQIEPGKE